MLYIFGGLPGTGKSTIASRLASDLKAVYLRVDTVENTMIETGMTITGPEGYVMCYRLAEDNLKLGLSVVADTVNPIEFTRSGWRDVAVQCGVPFVEIEVACSNKAEHRARVETRPASFANFELPTWDDVVNREYEPWDTKHILLDTAGQTPEQSIEALKKALESK
jgi:predicted kinase